MESLLHLACKTIYDAEIVQLLASHIGIDIEDNNGKTPLYGIIYLMRIDPLSKLGRNFQAILELGADIIKVYTNIEKQMREIDPDITNTDGYFINADRYRAVKKILDTLQLALQAGERLKLVSQEMVLEGNSFVQGCRAILVEKGEVLQILWEKRREKEFGRRRWMHWIFHNVESLEDFLSPDSPGYRPLLSG
jgi:hypothetical protein